jgi:hypothetical protein
MKLKLVLEPETLAIKKANIKGIYTNKDGSSMKPDVNGVYRLGNPIGFNLANQRCCSY